MTPVISPSPASRMKDLAFKFVALLFPAVMVYIIKTDGSGCGDQPRDFKFFPIVAGSAFVLAVVWSLIDRQRRDYSRLKYVLQILTRYFLAYIILQYGVAKVIDMQFSPNLSSLDTRAADMHPMTLAWTFFGYSFKYEFFIGCSQIVAAILLVFRRTATLGAILMVTIMANIVFVNFAFDVCVKFFSVTYLVMSLYLLVDDAPRLINFLLLNRTAEKRGYPEIFRSRRARRIFFSCCTTLLLVGVFYQLRTITTEVREYGIGQHSALYGVWAVDTLRSSRDSLNIQLNTDSSGWKKMLFEDYNNASIKSWKVGKGYFSYTVDTAKHLLTMKQTYPDTLSEVKAHYIRNKDTLTISGLYDKDSIYASMHLLHKYFIR